MKSFVISSEKKDKYKAVIYATSIYSPFDELEDISEELRKCGVLEAGELLFDLLLSNGNCFNRFVTAHFDGRRINRNSLSVINIEDKELVSAVNCFYTKNLELLSNGVLSRKDYMKFATSKF